MAILVLELKELGRTPSVLSVFGIRRRGGGVGVKPAHPARVVAFAVLPNKTIHLLYGRSICFRTGSGLVPNWHTDAVSEEMIVTALFF